MIFIIASILSYTVQHNAPLSRVILIKYVLFFIVYVVMMVYSYINTDSSVDVVLVGGIAGGMVGALLLIITILVIVVCVLVCQARRRGHVKFVSGEYTLIILHCERCVKIAMLISLIALHHNV